MSKEWWEESDDEDYIGDELSGTSSDESYFLIQPTNILPFTQTDWRETYYYIWNLPEEEI